MSGFAGMGILWHIGLTAVLSWLLTGLASWYSSRRGLLDYPGERHSHSLPTPRGGGIGLIAALLLASIAFAAAGIPRFWPQCALPGVIVLALLGWWDDHRSLSASLRLIVQLAVSGYLLACAASAGWLQGDWSMIPGILFLVWMTNLYNFMDGSNGMAGLQGVFAGSVLAGLFALAGDAAPGLLALLLAAACAGFLPWNIGRARVFMGDAGSLALGFSIAVLLLYGFGTAAFTLPVALLVMMLFLVDTTLTLAARVIRGERWYNAHRQHLYQRLIAHGWSHGRVAVFYQTINLALVLPGIGVAVRFPDLAWPAVLTVALVLGLGWLLLKRKYGVVVQAG